MKRTRVDEGLLAGARSGEAQRDAGLSATSAYQARSSAGHLRRQLGFAELWLVRRIEQVLDDAVAVFLPRAITSRTFSQALSFSPSAGSFRAWFEKA